MTKEVVSLLFSFVILSGTSHLCSFSLPFSSLYILLSHTCAPHYLLPPTFFLFFYFFSLSVIDTTTFKLV